MLSARAPVLRAGRWQVYRLPPQWRSRESTPAAKHPSACQHSLAVTAEVEIGAGAHQSQYLVQLVRSLDHRRFVGSTLAVEMADIVGQRLRHLLDGEDVIGQAGADGALRHARIFGRRR